MCIQVNGLKLCGALKEYLSLHNFRVKNAKNPIFKENKGFECNFDLKYR